LLKKGHNTALFSPTPRGTSFTFLSRGTGVLWAKI